MRARIRIAAALAWVGMCAWAANATTRHPAIAPLRFAPEPQRCVSRIEAELRPLRALLPEDGVVGYAGPQAVEDCNAMFVTQYALAPLWITEVGAEPFRVRIREVDETIPEQPPLVIAYGSEGREWLRLCPHYRPIAQPSANVILVGLLP